MAKKKKKRRKSNKPGATLDTVPETKEEVVARLAKQKGAVVLDPNDPALADQRRIMEGLVGNTPYAGDHSWYKVVWVPDPDKPDGDEQP